MSVNKTTNALMQTIEAKIQRRRFTPEQKHAMVVRTYSPGVSVSAVAPQSMSVVTKRTKLNSVRGRIRQTQMGTK